MTDQNQLKVTTKEMGIHWNKIHNMTIQDMTREDFCGEVQEGEFLAHIYWKIGYRFVGVGVGGYPSVVAQPVISPRSWMHPLSNDPCLIQHEYGHYLISCWCTLEFLETVNNPHSHPHSHPHSPKFKGTTIEQYKQWCAQIFKATLKKYCEIQRRYDEETRHYCDREQQALWESRIVWNINQYGRREKERESMGEREGKMEEIRTGSRELKKMGNSRRSFSHKNDKRIQPSKPKAKIGQFRIRQGHYLPPKLIKAV